MELQQETPQGIFTKVIFPEEIVGTFFKLRAQPTLSNKMKNILFESAIETNERIKKGESIHTLHKELEVKFREYTYEYKEKAETFQVFWLNIFNVLKKYRGTFDTQNWLFLRQSGLFNELFYPYNFEESRFFSQPLTASSLQISDVAKKNEIDGANRKNIYEYLINGNLPEKYDLTYKKGGEVSAVELSFFDNIESAPSKFEPVQNNLSDKFAKFKLSEEMQQLGAFIGGSGVDFRVNKFITDSTGKTKVNQLRSINSQSTTSGNKMFFSISGVPGLGKTTLGKFIASSFPKKKSAIISVDEIRIEVTGSEVDFTREPEVVEMRNKRFAQYCQENYDIIIWTDGDSSKGKSANIDGAEVNLLDYALTTVKKFGYQCIGIYLYASPEEVFDNISKRYRQITKDWLLNNMHKYSFENFNNPKFDITLQINPRENLDFKKDLKQTIRNNLEVVS